MSLKALKYLTDFTTPTHRLQLPLHPFSAMYNWVRNDPAKPEIQGVFAEKENVWFRHVDPMESFFSLFHHFIPGVSDTIVAVQLSLSPDASCKLTIETVKSAMREILFDHPIIAANHAWRADTAFNGVVDLNKAVLAYKVPKDEEDVQAWLSTAVYDCNAALEEANGDIDAAVRSVIYSAGRVRVRPLPLLSVRHISASHPDGRHGLVFLISHAISDGISAWQLVELFVDKIAALLAQGEAIHRPLPWGEEIARLPEPFATASPIPWTTPKVPEDSVVPSKAKALGPFLQDTYGLPIPYPDAEPSATGYITRTLPANIMASLRTVARQNGTTIFPLLYAIMALAVLRINPPPEDRLRREITNPVVTVPINLRQFIPDTPYDKSQWKAGFSIGYAPFNARHLERFARSSADHDVEDHGKERQLAKDVWTLSKEITAQLEEHKPHMTRAAVWAHEMRDASLAAPSNSALAPDTHVGMQSLSSMGIIDKYLSDIRPIPGPSGGTIIISNPRMCTTCYTLYGGFYSVFHPFTYKGELIVTTSFAEAAMGSEKAQLKAFEEGKRVAKGDKQTVVVEFVEEYMNLLRLVATFS